MAFVTLSNGKRFEATNTSSILDAAAQNHISLPYSCKTGRCSTCKCKVTSGRTRPLHPETGLTEEEKGEGWILSCVRAADTDVVLEVDDLGGIDLPVPKTWPCRISEIKPLAPDVVRVLLRLPPTADFRFTPGQYIDVIGPNGIRRSYSLANANFSDTRPKPMVEIGGKPILWHIMKMYSHHGINDFVVCCGYKGYVIKEYFANYFLHMSDVTFDMQANSMHVHEKRAEPWKVTLVDTGDESMTGEIISTRQISDAGSPLDPKARSQRPTYF